jgi:hypothetical protein
VEQEVVLAAMTMSIVASVGFAVAVTPLVLIPPRIVPRWTAALIGIMMLGSISAGNKLYHNPGSEMGLVLMIFLLTIPLSCAACFVFRLAWANQPNRESLIRPLLWAFGSILAFSTSLALVTVFFGGIPLSETPIR